MFKAANANCARVFDAHARIARECEAIPDRKDAIKSKITEYLLEALTQYRSPITREQALERMATRSRNQRPGTRCLANPPIALSGGCELTSGVGGGRVCMCMFGERYWYQAVSTSGRAFFNCLSPYIWRRSKPCTNKLRKFRAFSKPA